MVNNTVSQYKKFWDALKESDGNPKRIVCKCPPQLAKKFTRAMQKQRTQDLDWKVEHCVNPWKLSSTYDRQMQRIEFLLKRRFNI